MIKHNPNNERIKREYFTFLKEAKRRSEASVDDAAAAIARFETYIRHRDFKAFNTKQAIGFKEKLADQNSKTGKGKLSKATIYSTLAQLKRFFQWLSAEPGYRSQLKYTDAEFFNLSDKDSRIATARRPRPVPTLEQIRHVIACMPTRSVLERRNRAIVAFALLTGARDSAIATMKLKHVDLVAGNVFQDARQVNTKFSKTFATYFFQVGDDVQTILTAWIKELRDKLLWGNEDPLFPTTQMSLNDNLKWQCVGIQRTHWRTTSPIRRIFREAFAAADLPYFNPHSFRNTLVRLGETVCKTPEDFKAWSQNLGHEGVLTTFTSYGVVPPRRQGELIQGLREGKPSSPSGNSDALAEAVVQKLLERGLVQSHK